MIAVEVGKTRYPNVTIRKIPRMWSLPTCRFEFMMINTLKRIA